MKFYKENIDKELGLSRKLILDKMKYSDFVEDEEMERKITDFHGDRKILTC
jgi:hypothetical protein